MIFSATTTSRVLREPLLVAAGASDLMKRTVPCCRALASERAHHSHDNVRDRQKNGILRFHDRRRIKTGQRHRETFTIKESEREWKDIQGYMKAN